MEYLTLENLKGKTTVYEDAPLALGPVTWTRCGKVEMDVYMPSEDDYGFHYDLVENQEGLTADYSGGLQYFVIDLEEAEPATLSSDQLPTEFFNHQLFECGKKTKQPGGRVQEFMGEWGLLFSPLRNDWGCLDGWQFLETMSMQGVKETDLLIERMPELAGTAVSKLEAEATLGVLMETVLFLRKHIRSGGEDRKSLSLLARPLTAASCNPYRIDAGDVELDPKAIEDETLQGWADRMNGALLWAESQPGYQPPVRSLTLKEAGSLTSAICNQILDAMAIEDVPWRECACDGCDVIFKYSQSNAVNLNQDAYYCCPAHGARQRKRNSRSGQKGQSA